MTDTVATVDDVVVEPTPTTEDAAVVLETPETSEPVTAEADDEGLKEPERPATREMTRPDNDKFQMEMETVNEEIREIRDKIDVITNRMKATQNPEKSDEVTNLKKEARRWRTESFKFEGEVKQLKAEFRKYNDDVALHTQRKKGFESDGNAAGAGEQEIMLNGASRALQTTTQRLDNKQKECEKADKALAQSKEDLAKFYTTIETVKDQISEMEKERDDLRDTVSEKRDHIREKKTKLDESFQDFFKNREIWKVHKKAMHNYYLEKRKEDDKKWAAEKEAEEAAKTPYEDEMALCDFLAEFLEREFLGISTEKVTRGGISAEEKAKITFTTDDGKVLKAMKKKDEEFMVMGGGKKKKSKKRNKVEKLSHSVKIIGDFSKLDMEPPSTRTVVAKTVEDLRAKKTWYSEQPRPVKKSKARKPAQESSSNGDAEAPKKKAGKAYKSTSEDFPTLGGDKGPLATEAEAEAEVAPVEAEAEAEVAPVDAEAEATTPTEVETPVQPEEETAAATPAAEAEAEAATTTTPEEVAAPVVKAAPAAVEAAADKALPPADKMTYSDDKAIGVSMPDLSALKWLQGEAPTSGKPLVVLFWAKYAKGDYKHLVHFSHLADKTSGAQFVGVSCDAEEADAAKLLTKFGSPLLEQNIPVFECAFPLAFDADKVVGKAFQALSGLNMMSAGMAYIVNAEGTIVWREGFTSSWALEHGQFPEQLALLLEGKDLVDNGAAPEEDEGEVDNDADITVTTGPDPSEMFADTGDY